MYNIYIYSYYYIYFFFTYKKILGELVHWE